MATNVDEKKHFNRRWSQYGVYQPVVIFEQSGLERIADIRKVPFAVAMFC